MRAAVYLGKDRVEIKDDLEQPKPNSNEVLVKVRYCGICGSGVESFKHGGLYLPNKILGHEFSGDIVEIGGSVKGFKIGDRVSVNPGLPCGECYWCKQSKENMCKIANNAIGCTHDGGMAEYAAVRADQTHRIPDEMSYIEGACVEPLANCVYAVRESEIRLGENATVFGAGTIGLMTIQALSAAGVHQIYAIEPVKFKQEKALELGALKCLEPKKYNKVSRFTEGRGPDYIFDCVGIPESIMSSINLITRGGKIMLLGIHVGSFEMKGWMQVPLKNIRLQGIFGFTSEAFHTSLELIAHHKVDAKAIVTKIIKLDEVPAMFEELANPFHKEIKVLVEI
ncbi:MAG: D-arabitol-phosphate dehydrogenase [Promethearchaeota archaeon]|nr:MAG: D-arabitol-phosphate dehydrogenase [Candidatus Lokiarchaeota archaeon]